MPISVLIADDHKMVADCFARRLNALGGINVLDVMFTAKAAYEKTLELKPDVLVLDVKIPGGLEGPEIAKCLLKKQPELSILALSSDSNKESVEAMFAAGAMGYVSKDDEVEELARGIRKVHAGDQFLGETVAPDVIKDFILLSKPVDPVCLGTLTPREEEVMRLICGGASNKQVAAKLGVSIKTIDTHRTRIMRKLDCHSATQLTNFCHGYTTR